MNLVVYCFLQLLTLIEIIDLIDLHSVLSLTLLLNAGVKPRKDFFTELVFFKKPCKFTVLFQLFVPVAM
jgi:hypothetical protein